MKIGGACLNQTPIDWEGNLQNILEAIHQAKKSGVQLLCLPEMCVTGYGCEDLFHSPWIIEKAGEQLEKIIPETSNILVTIGLPISFEGRTYNCICIIQNQAIKGFYAKQKLANDGVHYEPRWFESWPSGVIKSIHIDDQAYPIGHIVVAAYGKKIGFEICEDAWRTDRPACHLAEPVDIILNPSASHFAFKKAVFREQLVLKSSKQFQCTYLYTNLVGNEAGRMIYDGDILIANNGKLIGRNRRLSFRDINLLYVDLEDLEYKVLPDFKSQNEEFSQAASLALFDYLRKSRSSGFVLSLSGGADSSTIATLISELVSRGTNELGFKGFTQKINKKNFDSYSTKELVGQLLTTAYQGTENSSSKTFNSASKLAESIGAVFHHWTIDDQVGTYTKTIEGAIGRELEWEKDDITLQNIQARARSPIIWMLANLNNALLLATSNRSEGDVGYATMDGDTSGSISPISGVSKTFILQWLNYAEKELGYKALGYVNSLQPTAELRPLEQTQTDEDDLMPYDALMKIERKVIVEKCAPTEVFNQLKDQYDSALLKSWIRKFHKLWSRNQWKRERYAPGFHFDDFNVDPRSWYRFPILNGSFANELDRLTNL